MSFVGYFIIKGWSEPMPFYRFYCKECKRWVVNYPSGHYLKLMCPICLLKINIEMNGDVIIYEYTLR